MSPGDKTLERDIKPDLLRSVGTRGNKAMIYASGMCFEQLFPRYVSIVVHKKINFKNILPFLLV